MNYQLYTKDKNAVVTAERHYKERFKELAFLNSI